MASRTPIDSLSSEIQDILSDYAGDVLESVTAAVQKVTKAGVKAVRSNAKRSFGGTGAYAKGWTSKIQKGKRSAQGTIYNKDMPFLPHLLEHGHLNRDGSRTPGKAHIAPVEDLIAKEFEDAICKEL